MTAQPLDSRMARIEGTVDQIVDRLNSVDARFAQMDQKFMWLIGISVTSWTTIMLAVLLHH